MSWTGRKRSQGDRYPCGKPRPRKPPTPPPQPHRKGYGTNPLAETSHGRYFLAGAISAPQHTAGSLYARARLRYRAAIGSPDSLRSRSEDHHVATGEDDARHIAEFETARKTLGRLAVDIEWIVIQDAMLSDLTAYRAGLDVLRCFYGV